VGTQRYLLSKLVQLFLTLVAVMTIAFVLFRLMPGDPVRVYLRTTGAKYTPEQIAQMEREYGFDRPKYEQYVFFMRDMFTLHLGESTFLYPGQNVSAIFWQRMSRSGILIITSTAASIVLGVYMGIYGGWRRGGRFDNTSMVGSLVLYAMPEFVLGMIFLLIFSAWLGWFPSGGYSCEPSCSLTGVARIVDILNHMALPWLTLTLAYLGEYYLLMRSSLLDVIGEEYITLARAKGVREDDVLRKHAVRNALLPTVTLIALSFGFVLGGVITVELVFSYPGVGLLAYQALQVRDYPLLEVTFLWSAIGVLVANMIADLTYAYLDPRVRTA
jgi:peptide/nickel transport system permease protein